MAPKKSHCTLMLYTLLLNSLVFNQASNTTSFYPRMDTWHTLRPGELLHNLDLITADAVAINAPVLQHPKSISKLLSTNTQIGTIQPTEIPSQAPPQIQRRIENDAENQYSTEDHLTSEHSNEYDYDKAYEQFVQRYFSKARDDALEDDVESGSVEHDEQQPYSHEYDSAEPYTASATKSKSRQKCKKVLKNQQECLICKNPKNNEKSETCSFSTESEPEAYAYTKEKSYKKHRDSSDESLEDENDDDDVDDENNHSTERKRTKQPERTNNTKRKVKQHNRRLRKRNGKDFERRKDNASSCTRKNYKYKTCYYCSNPGDKNLSKCFAKEAEPSNRDTTGGKQNQSTKQIQKSEKKIYKRMVTYSYVNGTNFDQSSENQNVAENNANIASPRVKRKIIFKLLKHKAIEQS